MESRRFAERVLRSVGFPGVLVFAAAYAGTTVLGARFLYPEARELWQHLAPEVLQAQYWQSLLLLHTQPPAFNALLGLVDRAGSQAPVVWQAGYLVAALTLVVSVADSVRLLTGNRMLARLAGLAIAVLPSTLLYSLWPAYTLPVSLLIVGMVWGLARAFPPPVSGVVGFRDYRMLGVTVSLVCATVLFLTRSSFAFPLAIAWIAGVLLLAIRRQVSARGIVIAVAAACLCLIAVVQGRSLVLFGSPTQSSWSGSNLYHALADSPGVDKDMITRVALSSPCFTYLLTRGSFSPHIPDSTILEGACSSYVRPASRELQEGPALDQLTSAAGQYNFNNRSELELAPAWQAFALAIIREQPTALLGIVAGTNLGDGSLGVFMGRSDTYNQVGPNWQAVPQYFGKLWPLSVAWSWVVFGIVAVGVPFVAFLPSRRRRTAPAYWFGVALLGSAAAVNLLAEFGENQRFRVELDPLAAVLAATTLWVLFSSGLRTSMASETPTTSPAIEPTATNTSG